MHVICAALSHDIDHRARIAPVFGIESVRDYAELVDGIRRRLDRRKIDEYIVGASAVHLIIVCTTASAIDGDYPGIRAAGEEVRTQLRLDARLQLQQLVGI